MRTALILLGLLTMLAYSPVLTAGWVYEDANAVQANPSVTGAAPIAVDRARWLSALSHRLVYHITGSAPRLPHLVNVALHVVNGILVYHIALAWVSPPAAVVVTALFWLHPLQTESVAYVASRSELLAACFALSAFLIAGSARSVGAYAAVCVAVLAAVCAKESAVVIVPLIVFADVVRGKPASWLRYAVWLLPVGLIAYTVIRFDYLSRAELSPLAYAATQATAVWRYLALAVYPIGQSVDHDFDLVIWPIRWAALGGIAALATVPIMGSWLVVLGDQPRGSDIARLWDDWPALRVASFGIAWLLIGLGPRFVMRIPEVLAEHQTYLPFIGLWIMLGAIVDARVFTQRDTHYGQTIKT